LLLIIFYTFFIILTPSCTVHNFVCFAYIFNQAVNWHKMTTMVVVNDDDDYYNCCCYYYSTPVLNGTQSAATYSENESYA